MQRRTPPSKSRDVAGLLRSSSDSWSEESLIAAGQGCSHDVRVIDVCSRDDTPCLPLALPLYLSTSCLSLYIARRLLQCDA